MHIRRKARELALQALYAYEMGDEESLDRVLDSVAETGAYDDDAKDYARQLVRKTFAAQQEIDRLIKLHAKNWELKRMAAIDRNILRMAIAELRFFRQVPFKVVIDEAVEIAKLYGGEESGKFVNGIIDSVRKEMFGVQADGDQSLESNE